MSSNGPPVAVITGGEGALGRAMAEVCRAAGWQVLAFSRRELDVGDQVEASEILGSLPRIDLLVNAAGQRRDGPFLKMPPDDWSAVLDVNLRGAWLCSRAVWPVMIRQGHGHIVNIGSGSARHGALGQTAYAAAKAGLLAMTQSLAAEGGTGNIRVNAVLPGWMRTPFNADLPENVHEAARNAQHLKRFNTPGLTAQFILFLHAMEHTSGQIFQLDSRPGSWL